MKFSICIPNYNYEKYVGRTIASVRAQTYTDWEILVSDNASSDQSVPVIQAFQDSRIKLTINACNVGFSGNLDRAARLATGDFMLMLSSDDLVRPAALETYHVLLKALGDAARDAVITSACDVIDPNDQVTGAWRLPGRNVWRESDRVPELELLVKAPVYRVPSAELLRRALPVMQNPLYFLATIYPRALYARIEGYGGGRSITPDKWFNWRLLDVAGDVFLIDRPLFAYRWHPANQAAQQSASGALKEQVDEYLNTIELDGKLLERAGISRKDLCQAFIEYGVAQRGLSCLGRGDAGRAKRILAFGKAAYPRQVWENRKAWALRGLLAAGPLGTWLARRLYARHRSENGAELSL